ncbi:MAG: hypothetical protein A4E63_02273 [Syntrophorhabdus sp. PtaU1.Bin050]|nr:MAG: hypothetical protein A4E63_02273 [Syntrophorhabdus sp. PtaU1.Bin050]
MFPQEVLKDLLHYPCVDLILRELFDHLLVCSGDRIHQFLCLLACHQFVGIVPDDLRQVGRYDGRMVNDSKSGPDVLVPVFFLYPICLKIKDRFSCRYSIDCLLFIFRSHCQNTAEHEFSSSHLDALKQNHIFSRLELQVIPQLHGRNHNTQFHGDLLPDCPYFFQKFPALLRVYYGDQTVTDLNLENLQGLDDLGFLLVFIRHIGNTHNLLLLGLAHQVTRPKGAGREDQKRCEGNTRHQSNTKDHR